MVPDLNLKEIKEIAKVQIELLVYKFEERKKNGTLSGLNESQTKNDFIQPLFLALGWNMDNNLKRNDSVTLEEKISKKRVDYGFKINNIPKFYLEAKAIREDLDDEDHIRQAINYSWHKACTWAVLSNFERTRIFNAEWNTDNLFANHYKTISYTDYIKNFDDLWLLSKYSFENGLLDKKALEDGRKLPSNKINEKLLDDMFHFREILSQSIIRNNNTSLITEEDIDEAVQRIIDRLIFIRFTEDKQNEETILISSYREWKDHQKGDFFKEIQKIYSKYDEIYNSKLFADHLCDHLKIDNDVLGEVINRLYRPRQGFYVYDFSIIESDVLGNIYEQYLGTILRKTAKSIKITSGAERRKDQGIYYTPSYIVNYIVANTVFQYLKYKGLDNAKKIRVLDPACGSGSFLMKSYDSINQYLGKKDESHTQSFLDVSGENQFYTKKLEIVKNNLFGVDIDAKAVEIAQLNLLLKISEKGQRLPLLQQNIKCGNSLVDDAAIAKDKTFIWGREFEEIINEGGFNVIIGNPPYVQLSMDNRITQQEKDYLKNRYGSSMGRLNTFGLFIKLGIDLLAYDGLLGFIVPNTLLTQDYYIELRSMILDSCKIISIVNFSDLPFKDAVVENTIIILRKTKSDRARAENMVTIYGVDKSLNFIEQRQISQRCYTQNPKRIFYVSIDSNLIDLRDKMKENAEPLSKYFNINQAIALKHERAKYLSKEKIDDTYKKVIDGRNIERYNIVWDSEYLKYDINAIHSCKREDIFQAKEKIFFRRVGASLIAALDNSQLYALNTLIVMNKKPTNNIDIRYFLGIFNSKLMTYYYRKFLKSTKTVFSEIQARQVKELPIKIDEENKDTLISYVELMLGLHKILNSLHGKRTDQYNEIEKEIVDLDKKIDQLVYKIYNLTQEQIIAVENSIK